MKTYTGQDGNEHCCMCRENLTAARTRYDEGRVERDKLPFFQPFPLPPFKHECDPKEMEKTCLLYRRTLEDVCNDANDTGCDGLTCVTKEQITEAHNVLDWEE